MRLALGFLLVAVFSQSAQAAVKSCQVTTVGKLPITMNNLRPLIPAQINGQDVKFILDSGAFYSMISFATASEHKLKLSPGPYGLTVIGVGGVTAVQVATVKEFGIVGLTIKNVEFLVGGSEVGSAGLLGQNLLEKFDVEYDLANGVIRLFKTEGCEGVNLAYWRTPQQDFSMMDIGRIDPLHARTIGSGQLNGKKIRIQFDTGAYTSVLSLGAAERAGITPDTPGVVEEGYSSGIGRGQSKTYIGTFSSFKVGDGEEIQHARIKFSDIRLDDTDMLLGADFFVSHRIFVANKEHRLFLTYNGGAVFNLSKNTSNLSPSNQMKPFDRDERPRGAASEAAGIQPTGETGPNSVDPAELARRGAALAARRDFVPALADLSEAIELMPNEPEYYFQRANVYQENRQGDLALADFDRVITLKPNFLSAYIPRAQLKLEKKERSAALEDLDALDHLAPQQADLRFSLAKMDQRLDRPAAAIVQFGLWIQSHPDDSRVPQAMSERCLSSALQNQDLRAALNDCNTALRRLDKANKNYSYVYVNRALVRLRQGDYARAVADCDDALKRMPENALALYARAVAEARQSKKQESVADLQAAKTIAPDIGDWFERYGIVP